MTRATRTIQKAALFFFFMDSQSHVVAEVATPFGTAISFCVL